MADTIKEVLTELNDKARDERASCTERGNWDGYNFVYEKLEAQALAEIKRIVEDNRPELPPKFATMDDFGVMMYQQATTDYHNNLMKALGEE